MVRKLPFIVLEGPDGVGKGTQLRLLVEWLKSLGLDVWETREPTDMSYGQKIRRILDKKEPMPEATEFQMLYVFDRAEHVPQIAAAMMAGKLVICDRYDYSTLAYGEAGGADVDALREAGKDFPRPDLMLWLNLDSNSARARMEERGELDEHDKNLSFQERLQEAYRKRVEEFPEAKEVDAAGNPDDVHQRIRKVVEKILPKAE